MTAISSPRDNNRIPALIGVSSSDGKTPVLPYVDPVTHRLLVDNNGAGGQVNSIVAGINITVDNTDPANPIISSTGGLGAPVEPTSGTINNSNKDFTFLVKPTLVNVSGVSYREGKGWSWTAETLTVTLDNPVGTGGDIFAL